MDLGDLFREMEAESLARARREIAAEKAAWDSLTPQQQADRIAAAESKYGDDDTSHDGDDVDACSDCGEPGCDGECGEELE